MMAPSPTTPLCAMAMYLLRCRTKADLLLVAAMASRRKFAYAMLRIELSCVEISHHQFREGSMWKKVLGYSLLALVLVAALGFAYLYLRSPATAPPSNIKVDASPARIARGKYI